MAFWRKNGHIVGINGIPIECDECPCGRTCIIRVKSEKKRLLDTGMYSLVSEMGDNYNCAEFGYDENDNLVCTMQAEGTLVQVLERYANNPASLSLNARYLVYAVTLRRVQNGSYLTIGCECNVDSNEHSCTYGYVELSNHCISNEVNVLYKNNQSEYNLQDSCKPIQCEAGELMLSTYDSWYGGTLYSEGFFTTSNLNGANSIAFTTFKKLFIYVNPQQEEKAYVMDCNCVLDELENFNANSRTILELNGICTSHCREYECLKALANNAGWNFYEEGALVHLSSASVDDGGGEPTVEYADWYDTSYASYLACAQNGNVFYGIPCNCENSSSVSIISMQEDFYGNEERPSNYYRYIEIENACSGIDLRELLSEYPDVFGVEEISWGSNTKYHYSTRYTMDDWVWNEDTQEYDIMEVEHVNDGYGVCGSFINIGGGGGTDFYLDYRTMCFIMKALDSNGNVKYRVKWISPQGSPSGSSQTEQLYDSAEFAGHMTPFQNDEDIRCNWTGKYLQWYGNCSYGNEPAYFDTQSEAESYCSSYTPSEVCIGICGSFAYEIPAYLHRISPPINTYTLVSGKVEYQDWWGKWTCTPPHYEIGEPIVYDNRAYNVVYREQWIDTNRGLMRYGEDGYVDAIMVYGIRGSLGNPRWENCFDHSGVPYEDEMVYAQIVDEDFHEQNGHTAIEDLYNAGQDNEDETQE